MSTNATSIPPIWWLMTTDSKFPRTYHLGNGSDVPRTYTGNDANLRKFVEFRVAEWIDTIYVPICAGFGIFGNLASLCVLLSLRMPRSSTHIYMAALAVSDSFIQIFNVLFLVRKFPGHEVLVHGTCGLVFFLFYCSVHFNVAVMVAMTVERYLAIRFPLKAIQWSTPRRACVAVGGISVATALLELHHLFIRGMIWNDYLKTEVCVPVGERSMFYLRKIWPWIDGAIYCYIPLLSLLIFNILISREMSASRQFRRKSTRNVSDRNSQPTGDQGHQVTVMLLFVTFTFMVLVGPNAVTLVVERYVWVSASDRRRAVNHLIRTVINNLSFTNHAINFFLYYLSGRRFRQEFLRLVRHLCGCARTRKDCSRQTRMAAETIQEGVPRVSSTESRTSVFSLRDDSSGPSPLRTYTTRL